MNTSAMEPEPLNNDPSRDRIVVRGIELKWDIEAGTFTYMGLPVAMMWIDSTLAGLMSGVATMVGSERFSLALQSEGRKSIESDWLIISRYPNFSEGFAAIGITAAVAGWGEWRLITDAPERKECRFRAYNTWEGLYQRKLGTCWGSAMLAGKLAGYCSKRFGMNCWALQLSFIAKGDPFDEFIVTPSPLSIETEIERLLITDQATRADLAGALTRLKDTQKATIQESEHRLRMIIEHSPMSMAIVRMDGLIEFINRKTIETFGYLPEDVPTMERWWLQAYPDPAYRQEVISRWTAYTIEAIKEGREIQRDEYRVTCKDGSVKTIMIFGVPVADRVFVMFDDITVRALKEDLLRRANIELESRVEKRTAELKERNHSLQTEIIERKLAESRLIHSNLTLEQTTAQLRKLGAKLTRVEEQERKRMAHILHDQLQQMLVSARFSLSMLEQDLSDHRLLATAQAASKALGEAIRESKSLVLDLSPPVLREGGLPQAMKWIRQRMLENYNLTVDMQVDEGVGTIDEDLRVAIFQGVRELLLNVVKHSKVSTAEVRMTLLPNAHIQVVVSDKGQGYLPAQIDPEKTCDTGFGLFALRERFESLGGSMTVESRSSGGFCVTLNAPLTAHLPPPRVHPVECPPPSIPVATEEVAPKNLFAPTPRIRVLLTDDHLILRQGLMQLLSRDPRIEVVGEAQNGEVAIELARSLRPQVILMDVNMPVKSGIETTYAIHAEFPEIVIIGLSMYEEPHRIDEMRQAGASAYVSKSEAAETLIATIHASLAK